MRNFSNLSVKKIRTAELEIENIFSRVAVEWLRMLVSEISWVQAENNNDVIGEKRPGCLACKAGRSGFQAGVWCEVCSLPCTYLIISFSPVQNEQKAKHRHTEGA